MLQRVKLHRLSANEARARSLLARELRDRPVPALAGDGEAAQLSLEPLRHSAQHAPFSKAQQLELDWAGACVVVELPAGAIEACLRASLGGAAPAELSPAWREAAVARAMKPLLEALGQGGQGQARLVAHRASSTAAVPMHAFSFTLHYPKAAESVHGRLHLDNLGLMLAAGIASRLEPLDHTDDCPALPVPMWLSIGHTDITAGLLRTVNPGDVLLVTHRHGQDGNPLMLTTAGARAVAGALVQADGTQLTVIDSVRSLMPDTPHRTDSSSAPSWDELPVLVAFDVGQTTLTLQQLKRLQPGETLTLARPVDSHVTIRANGAVIGSGELVDIDGRLGVSVLSLHAPAHVLEHREEAPAGVDEPDDEDADS